MDFEATIRWADAFILMYSVTDKCSFDECARLQFLIGYNKRRRKNIVNLLYILKLLVLIQAVKAGQILARLP